VNSLQLVLAFFGRFSFVFFVFFKNDIRFFALIFLAMVVLYFVGIVTVSFISYLFLVQLTILNFLVSSAFFVLILAGLNLKFFGHQLENNAV
jgi:hypothetical protein